VEDGFRIFSLRKIKKREENKEVAVYYSKLDTESFFNRLVTADEKWVMYHNPKPQ